MRSNKIMLASSAAMQVLVYLVASNFETVHVIVDLGYYNNQRSEW
jgi:hypothetical protein